MAEDTIFTQDVVNELADAIESKMENNAVVGISRDFSKAQPSLTDLALTSPMVQSMLESIKDSTIGQFTRDAKGDWTVASYTWGTTDPDDGNGCCFVPFKLQAGKEQAKVFGLCLKDCESTLDKMMNKQFDFKGTDLVNYFQKIGWTYDQSLQFLAWFSFAFRTQRTIAQGTTTITGVPGLRKFHGIVEAMSHEAVTPIMSPDVLAGFAQAGHVLDILTPNGVQGYAIFVSPLGHIAIDEVVKPGLNGALPDGWERGDFGTFFGTKVTLKFKGVPVVRDIYVPKDKVAGTFEAYIINTNTTKASMVYKDLMIPEDAIYTSQTIEPDSNCKMTVCDVYENAGVVHSANYAKNILIAGMKMSASAPVSLFTRVAGMIDGEVPFPNAVVPATAVTPH